jgi:phenylalanyl-tRNA synthetase beta chain
MVAQRLERSFSGDKPRGRLTTASLPMRDLAIIVDATTPSADGADAIRAHGGELLRGVRFVDLYTGEGVPAGQKSRARSLTYQSPERTLTDAEIEAEVEAAQTAVVTALAKRFGADLRR